MKYYLAEDLLVSSFIINKCKKCIVHWCLLPHNITYKINKGSKQFKSVCLPLLKSDNQVFNIVYVSIGSFF